MGRILLTSSQVSTLLYTIIVTIFVILLFSAGYHAQQQSLKHIRKSIAPNLPHIPTSHILALTNQIRDSRIVRSQDSNTLATYQKYKLDSLAKNVQTTINWSRLAYIQVVTDHSNVCSAIMLFADLHKAKSPAKRVLLFPVEWALGAAEMFSDPGDSFNGNNHVKKAKDPFMHTTGRLLRIAIRRYGVELRPITGHEEKIKENKWFRKEDTSKQILRGDAELRDYMLENMLEVDEYDKILYLRTPGLIIDANALDSLMAYHDGKIDQAVIGSYGQLDAIFLTPSLKTAIFLRESRAGMNNRMFLSQPVKTGLSRIDVQVTTNEVFGSTLDATEKTVLASMALLQQIATDTMFDGAEFLRNRSAYLTFTDIGLPSPENSIPFDIRVASRPKNKEADRVWTKLYGRFAENRRLVCGLELESWYI